LEHAPGSPPGGKFELRGRRDRAPNASDEAEALSSHVAADSKKNL